MNFNISLVDILMIFAVIVLLTAFFIPKKKGYQYNSLDQKGVIFNIVLSIIYVPLSLAGIFTVFFWDAPTTGYSELKLSLLNAVTGLGLAFPLISLASIFISATARKRGKSKFSFLIQFLPALVFAVLLGLVCFMGVA